MELRELKKGDRFTVKDTGMESVLVFDHLDGMHSYNVIEGTEQVVHLKHWTPVELVPTPTPKKK